MATKMRKALAIALVVLQLAALFAFNTSAAVTPAAQTIYRVDTAEGVMQLDGEVSANEPWNKVGAIPLHNLSTASDKDMDEGASVKVMWGKDDNGVYIYALLQYNDNNVGYDSNTAGTGWSSDGGQFAIDETGTSTSTTVNATDQGTLYRTGNVYGKVTGAVQTQRTCQYFVSRKTEGTHDVVVIEAKLTLNTDTIDASSVIGFNVLAQNYISDNYAMQCSCNGANVSGSASTFVKCTLNGTYAKNLFIPDAQTLLRADASAMELDGKVSATEPWGNVEAMSLYNLGTNNVRDGASVKAMWGKDDTGVYVYALLQYNDSNNAFDGGTSWAADGCQFAIDETGTSTATTVATSDQGTLYRTGNVYGEVTGAVQTQRTCQYFVSRKTEGTHDVVVIEAKLKLNTATIDVSSVIGFNVMAQNYISDSSASQCSINKLNINTSAHTFAKCTLSETFAPEPLVSEAPDGADTDAPVLIGAQRAAVEGGYDLRLVARMTALDYTQVGFKLDLTYTNGTESVATGEYDAVVTTVYKYLKYTDADGNDRTYYAGDDAYFVAYTIKGVPLTDGVDVISGTIRTYAVGAEEYLGSIYNVTITDGGTPEFTLGN